MAAINWEQAVEVFIVKKDMNPEKGPVNQTVKLAKRMGSQDLHRNPLLDRVATDRLLESVVIGTRYTYPNQGGPWNGLVLLVKVAVFTLDNYSCIYCGAPPSDLDHIVPKRSKGNLDLDRVVNLASSCGGCNTSKGQLGIHKFVKKVKRQQDPERLRRKADVWEDDQPEYAALLRRLSSGIEQFLESKRQDYEQIDAYVRKHYL